MTTKTQKNEKLFLTLATILAVTVIAPLVTTQAYAYDCSYDHCYAVAYKSVDNLGGYAEININSGNYVSSSYGIWNPVWVGFSTNEWLEGGWQKGTGATPCDSISANFYTWMNVDTPYSGTCVGSVSGSTVTIQISDTNEDGYWGILVNGYQEDTYHNEATAISVSTGGESSNENNVLDNGRSQSLEYADTNGDWNFWDSATLEQDASYTASWNTQYTDLAYEGP
ncbi:MAG TPA: hypothetical protein VFM64_00995 [Candidatus Nitrosotenuis sp.]|nr:hypothetical protein [Candidatus Nitrosotenuis sp.]